MQGQSDVPVERRNWEKFVEDNLTIVPLATLIQKRSGGLTSRGLALAEAQQKILAKNLAVGAEAADHIQRQELAALAMLTCAWDGCNGSATIRCPWCHLRDTDLSAGPERCTGREAQRADEWRREQGQHR